MNNFETFRKLSFAWAQQVWSQVLCRKEVEELRWKQKDLQHSYCYAAVSNQWWPKNYGEDIELLPKKKQGKQQIKDGETKRRKKILESTWLEKKVDRSALLYLFKRWEIFLTINYFVWVVFVAVFQYIYYSVVFSVPLSSFCNKTSIIISFKLMKKKTSRK